MFSHNDTNFVFTPGKLTIAQDGGAGSSGKGKLGAFVTEHANNWQFCCNTFAPQAGHWVKNDDGKEYFYQTLNSCAYQPYYEKMYLGPGAIIELPALFREIEENEIKPPRLGISPVCAILQDQDAAFERGEVDLDGNKLPVRGAGTMVSGSTCHGVGAALARRRLRRPDTKLARDIPELKQYMCDVPGEIMDRLDRGQAGFLEIAQGFQLSYLLPEMHPYCLSGDSRVLMADGTTKKIRDLQHCVGQHVTTRAADGTITTKPIDNWWRKSLGNRKWYNVLTTTSIRSEYDRAWWGAKFTGDHLFNTVVGAKRTTDLKPGDRLYTTDKVLERDGLQIFLGSMLGDGSVCAVKKSPQRASFQISHGSKQSGYCEAKSEIMAAYLKGGVRVLVAGNTAFKPGSEVTRYESAWSRVVREAATFYGCYGRKTPSMEAIVADLDWRGLAIWYQDDGRLKTVKELRRNGRITRSAGHNIELFTNGFTWSECSRLSAALSLKFSLHFSVVRGQKGQPVMMLSRYDHTRWFQNIARYIHPELLYKLPESHRNHAAWDWNDHPEPPLATEEITGIIECHPQSRRRGYDTCFDIEVADTHNFFVSNGRGFINTHNCTSKNCTVAAGLDDMMLPTYYAGNVLINYRTFPIRISSHKYISKERLEIEGIEVGTHLTWDQVQEFDARGLQYEKYEGNSGPGYPDQEETTWDAVTEASGAQDPIIEMTSVTKLPRRVFTFSRQNVKDSIRHNRTHGKTFISINFANYIDAELLYARGIGWRAGVMDPSAINGGHSVDTTKIYDWCRRNIPQEDGILSFIGTGARTDDFILLV